MLNNYNNEMEAALRAEAENERQGVIRGSSMFARLLDNMLRDGYTVKDFFELQREVKADL